MSMICGIYRRAPGPTTGLDAMLAELPASETAVSAAWTEGAVGLGWRGDPNLRSDRPERLPRAESGPGFAVTASVRLDDRANLCNALGIPRPERAGFPDSALLLRAWERWGRECPGRLLGDFAFAIWDARCHTLFLARDHVGTRPLFYSLTPGHLVFASDIGAVLAAPGVSDALDEAAVATELDYEPPLLGDRTHYRAVRRLRPGHALFIAGDTAHHERWWRPEDAPPVRTAGDDALAEELRELCSRALEDRMRGVPRIGVQLSGGLDSSSVAALAASARRRSGEPPPPAFAWQPPLGATADGGGEATEHALIEAVRRMYGLDVFYCPPNAAGMVDYLRRDGTRHLNIEPNEEFLQQRAAEQGIRVLLTGWGGDEGISFSGHGYEAELLLEGRVAEAWRLVRQRSRRPLAALVLRAALPLVWPAGPIIVNRLRNGKWPFRRRTLAHPAFTRRARTLPAFRFPRAGVRRIQLGRLQMGYLAERMDGWATSAARHGIEYAHPFLDRRVLEFALGLPRESYRRETAHRWIMRNAFGPLLPANVRRQVSKSDPVRCAGFVDALEAARPALRKTLATRPAPPGRSAYVDMHRLMATLDQEHLPAGHTTSILLRTLRFLDI